MNRLVLAVLAAALLSGCVSFQTMALQKGQGALNTASKSVVLMTIEVSRADESRYQPVPTTVHLKDRRTGTQSQSPMFRLNRKSDEMTVDGHTICLTSLALSPGRYQLEGISGAALAFPFVGQFFIPVLAEFEVKADSITYVGRVDATMRPRREGEFRAGAVIPLIDQGATGMISHSWDVVIEDRSAADLTKFREHVPALAGLEVKTELLPAWDRAAAQRRWDGLGEPEPKPEPVESGASSSQ